MSHQSRDRFIRHQPEIYVSQAAPRRPLAGRIFFTLARWRERIELRRRLAEMDSRSLRELGISPAAAAYESGKPFWQKVGCLR